VALPRWHGTDAVILLSRYSASAIYHLTHIHHGHTIGCAACAPSIVPQLHGHRSPATAAKDATPTHTRCFRVVCSPPGVTHNCTAAHCLPPLLHTPHPRAAAFSVFALYLPLHNARATFGTTVYIQLPPTTRSPYAHTLPPSTLPLHRYNACTLLGHTAFACWVVHYISHGTLDTTLLL